MINCIFANKKFNNGCAALNDDVVCKPETCKWRHTERSYFESLDKAWAIYKKRTGRENFLDTQKTLPESLRKRYMVYRAMKQRELAEGRTV